MGRGHGQTVTDVTYFDHNATSPLLPLARAVWLEAEDRYPGNPSSPHRIGARADAALAGARQRLAAVLECSPEELVWTSGATESCNQVVHHAATVAEAGAAAWVNASEHPAVLESARHYFGGRVKLIPVDARGVVDLEWLAQRLRREKPALVAVMAANNETGVLQPCRQVHELCEASSVLFFCDATQWCGRRPMNGLGRGAFLAASAHKFGGPRGVGILKCSAPGTLRPLLRGGKQQDQRRAGTENVPGILATLAALEWCEQQMALGEASERRAWRERFEREVVAAVPGARVNGAGVERLWNTVSLVMPDADCRQRWVVKLDKAGFAVSTGSACASGLEQPSHVLTAMGLSAAEAGRAVRVSAGWLTPVGAWDALLEAFVQIHQEIAPAAATR